MQRWEDTEALLCQVAQDDLADGEGIRPTLLAFAGPRPLLLVRCRPFDRGRGPAALAEVLAVVVPMGADRIALSVGGRAWIDDAAAGDVVMIAVAERTGGAVRVSIPRRSVTSCGGAPVVGPPVSAGPASGWLHDALHGALTAPCVVPPDPEVITALARHAVTVGHALHLPDDPTAVPITAARNARPAHAVPDGPRATAPAVTARTRFDTRR